MTLDTVIARSASALTAEVGAQVVMLVPERNSYFDADTVGSALWRALTVPQTVRALCDAVLARYDVARAQGETDVLAFFESAHREGLIEIVSA
jgi:hypothetical protein